MVKGIPFLTFPGHSSVVYGVKWHPTLENIMATNSADRSLKIWDTRMNKCIKTFMAHHSEVMSCDFNKYNNTIATAGSDGSIHIFDLRGTGDLPLQILNGHSLTARRVVFSPFYEGILASCSYDMNVMIWDVQKNSPINVFKHHREFVCGIDFSIFNNKGIASVGWDKMMYVFDWDKTFSV